MAKYKLEPGKGDRSYGSQIDSVYHQIQNHSLHKSFFFLLDYLSFLLLLPENLIFSSI